MNLAVGIIKLKKYINVVFKMSISQKWISKCYKCIKMTYLHRCVMYSLQNIFYAQTTDVNIKMAETLILRFV